MQVDGKCVNLREHKQTKLMQPNTAATLSQMGIQRSVKYIGLPQ